MPKIVTDEPVFETVIKLIEEYGYVGTTTKQIADAADINEVTLFRKYGSKAQLVKEAVSHYASRAVAETAIVYTGDLEADLRQVVETYLGAAEQHARVFPIIMSEMARYPELSETMQAPLGIVTDIAQLLDRYQQDGSLRRESPLQAVGALLGPLIVNTMLRQARIEGIVDPVDLDEHVTGYIYGRVVPKD